MKLFTCLVFLLIGARVAFDLHPKYLSRHLNNMAHLSWVQKKENTHKVQAFKNQGIIYNFIIYY
jgi:hypothetical protein